MRKFVTCEALIAQGIFANKMGPRRAIDGCGFPKPYRLGNRRQVWDWQEVERWLDSRRGQPESHRRAK